MTRWEEPNEDFTPEELEVLKNIRGFTLQLQGVDANEFNLLKERLQKLYRKIHGKDMVITKMQKDDKGVVHIALEEKKDE